MPIPIKIQCSCGQRYAFDIEPVSGRMPGPVACPVCGVDGTAAANAAITQSLPAQPAVAVAPAAAVRVQAARPVAPAAPALPATSAAHEAAITTPGRGPAKLPGQKDRTQAEQEARAKMSWGDPPEAVVTFLMMQGFSQEEAKDFVQMLTKERTAAVRGIGFRKIVIGVPLMFVPVVYFILVGLGNLQLWAVCVMIGLYGAWSAFKGVFMLIAPKTEKGDLADQ